MQENADCEKECEKWWCPGFMGEGRAGKHNCSSHSATSLLPSPGGGWIHVPAVAGLIVLMCHISLTYTIATEIVSVPGYQICPFFSSLCFFEEESASVEFGRSFTGRQRSGKHFQLPQYGRDFPWEPTPTASQTGCFRGNTSTVSAIPSKEEKRVRKLLCWKKLFIRFYILGKIFTIKLGRIQLFGLHNLL